MFACVADGSVSGKHLQSYLDEYAFLSVHAAKRPGPMFKILLGNVRRLAA
jgi:hypothetical protein